MILLKKVYLLALLIVLIIGCKKEAKQKRPNILFAISDDQTFQHTSFAGCNFVNTPAFDRVAREGVYFSNCYAGSPGCAPSRSSLVTGRHHWQNEQSGQHASSWLKKHVPFIDLLEKNGYSTGRTGKGVSPFQYARNENDSLWRISDAGGVAHSNISYKKGADERVADGISKTNYAENFKYFVDNIKEDKPFFFWYGANEPHRAYEKGSWNKMGKKLSNVTVPEFLPDNEEIRGDLLDYAVEIEWFDLHLQQMLEYLDQIGELENTIVIVTADNGMPFPRAKANCYEYGTHVPMAIRYPKNFPANRIIKDPVTFIDITPTILEITSTTSKGMLPITGVSMLDMLTTKKSGFVSTEKERAVFSGRERHSSSRYLNWGYPQRVIRQGEYILIWNMKAERWPAGAPQKYDPKDTTKLLPMYGLDKQKKYMRQSAFTDIDDCPSKTYIIENYEDPEIAEYFRLAHEKRPKVELYNVTEDPYCLNNLAENAEFASIESKLKDKLMGELQRSNDPRVVGPDKQVFDSYIRYSHMRKFPKPEWAK